MSHVTFKHHYNKVVKLSIISPVIGELLKGMGDLDRRVDN